MKKYITCTLFSFAISYIIHAQELARPEFAKIITPFIYLNDVSLSGQNLLFEKEWVKAKLLTANNSVISNDSFFFNFDKIDKRLLTTADFRKIFEIDWREFKAILFYWHDSAYIFKHIYDISNKDLFQVVINSHSKYSLFKTVHTKIVKGSYGSASFGRSMDKYMDIPEYCILFPNREYRKIHMLKRSAIERVFKLDPDSEKVDDFLNMTAKNTYDEEDLKKLIDYLNKEPLQ